MVHAESMHTDGFRSETVEIQAEAKVAALKGGNRKTRKTMAAIAAPPA